MSRLESRQALKLRYDGPCVLDVPNAPKTWTILSHTVVNGQDYFRFTLSLQSLKERGLI